MLIMFYLIIVTIPLVLATFWGPRMGNTFYWELGKNFALLGFMILAMQSILAGRLKWIERAFGFDILIRFHKYMGILAFALLIGHPLLLVMGGAGWGLLTSTSAPWYILVAKIALLLLVINVLVSVYSQRIRLKFERWRFLHDLFALGILVLGFLHSWRTGGDFAIAALQWYWAIVFLLTLIVFLYHRLIRPWRLSRHRWKVSQVSKEIEKVWTVRLEPPEGHQVFEYLPGQFQFITFRRKKGLPVEEHHWTISSSPAQKGFVESTIKELGDFTANIGQTRAGDSATVQGPFGRFSYLLRPDDRDLVFVAGGIGITPLMGMLRHMRDTQADLTVLLIYANRAEGEIAFRRELDKMVQGERPRLKLVHLLSKPEEGWPGEKGRLDEEKLRRYCDGNFENRTFYLCGPPPMVSATLSNLRALGVRDDRIETEVFSFLD
jgi:predicted ferric reductase